MPNYIGSIDQGTTSTRFCEFERAGGIFGSSKGTRANLSAGRDGWSTIPPRSGRATQDVIARSLLQQGELRATDLAAIGITNQRETTVLWNRKTGKPVANALVWQDTRVDDCVTELSRDGGPDRFRAKTGLPLSTYFSGLKIRWLLDHVAGVREQAEAGEVIFGNIDTFLTWHLTGGRMADFTSPTSPMPAALNSWIWTRSTGIKNYWTYSAFRSVLPRICSSAEVYGTVKTSAAKGT